MKIILAIYDVDDNYTMGFYSYFKEFYTNSIDVYAFNSKKGLVEFLKSNCIEVLLIHQSISIDFQIDSNIVVLKLLEKNIICDEVSLYKYQKMSSIYKEILACYSTVFKSPRKNNKPSVSSKNPVVISFLGIGAGSGTSSLALACAEYYRLLDNKVLFLDLQLLSSAKSYLYTENRMDLSDVIYALKTKKENLEAKLLSSINTSESGVEYINFCRNPIDRKEMDINVLEDLIKGIELIGVYDFIIIDYNLYFGDEIRAITEKSNLLVLVGDGSENSNIKLNNAIELIKVWEKIYKLSIIEKVCCIHNKYSLNEMEIKCENIINKVGSIPLLEFSTNKKIISELGKLKEVWEDLNKIIK